MKFTVLVWVLGATVDGGYGEKASYYSAVCLETGEVLEGNSNSGTSAAFLGQLQRHSGRLVIWDVLFLGTQIGPRNMLGEVAVKLTVLAWVLGTGESRQGNLGAAVKFTVLVWVLGATVDGGLDSRLRGNDRSGVLFLGRASGVCLGSGERRGFGFAIALGEQEAAL